MTDDLNIQWAELPLSNGGFTKVDADLFDWLNQWIWTRYTDGDVARGENHKVIRIHRIINQTPVGFETDHKNGDKSDNRRANLRTATKTQNSMNRAKRKNCSSKYKGVWWHKKDKLWHTGIRVDKRLINLGSYKHEIQAAKAYNQAAQKHFGKFARLND